MSDTEIKIVSPWVEIRTFEIRRKLIVGDQQLDLIQLWGKTKRGVSQWRWRSMYPAYNTINPFGKLSNWASRVGYQPNFSSFFLPPPSKESMIHQRKKDAMREVDELLRNEGYILASEKQLLLL